MAALSSGHLATDFANGALPALLPFFVDKFDLSYTLAAAAVLASAVSSSIVQPLFGLWSDRRIAARGSGARRRGRAAGVDSVPRLVRSGTAAGRVRSARPPRSTAAPARRD